MTQLGSRTLTWLDWISLLWLPFSGSFKVAEVLSDQMFEEDAEASCPPVVQLVHFLPDQLFRLVG